MTGRRYSNVAQFIALAATVLLGLFILMCLISGDWRYLHSLLGWISSFMRSAGFGGLCALLAARIAWTGVQKQVEVNRSGVSQQGDVERDKSWWSRLEWVADRSLPAPGKEISIPPAVAINTLHELAKTAVDEVQSKTVGSMIDELVAISVLKDDSTLDRSSEQESRDRTNQALMDYAEATEKTAAESLAAAKIRYQTDVLNSISQQGVVLSDDPFIDSDGFPYRPDALFSMDGIQVILEIQYHRNFRPIGLRQAMGQTINMVASTGVDFGILVVPYDIPDAEKKKLRLAFYRLRFHIGVVSWAPMQGSDRLIELIRHEISRSR